MTKKFLRPFTRGWHRLSILLVLQIFLSLPSSASIERSSTVEERSLSGDAIHVDNAEAILERSRPGYSFLPTGSASFQVATNINGKVTDARTGEGLPGVNIIIKGTSTGTVTDVDGNYSVSVSNPDDVLVFSYLGYVKQEVPLNGRSKIDISLGEDVQSLEEVVVVGYGVVKKSDLTGSVSSIKVDEMSQGIVSSVDQLLLGKSAGVNVVQNSGEPGGGFSLNIRGSSSVNASNDPLYVIDGVPMINERPIRQSGAGIAGSATPRNPLSSLNPQDIESIEILKDASATAIYGARGANGVVLITTKSGQAGSMKVDYSGSVGIQNWSNKLDLLNAEDYKRIINDIVDAGGADESFRVPDNISSTDWQDEVARKNAVVQSQQLSFSGGSEKTKYYFSFNYMDQEGIVKSSGFTRYGGRMNLETQVSDKITVGVKFTNTFTQDNYVANTTGVIQNSGVLQAAYTFDPTIPVRNADGDYATSTMISVDNPLAIIEGVNSLSNSNRTFASAFAKYQVSPDFSVRVNVGTDVVNENRKTFVNDKALLGRQNNGIGNNQTSDMSNFLFEGTMNYNKTMGVHSVNALGGITFQRTMINYLRAESSDFPSLAAGANNLGLGTKDNFQLSNYKQGNRLASYIGRVNYSLRDKYLVTVTARADGSSRFGKNNKFGFFPSVAFGWKLMEETFMAGTETFSNLKLRASWGMTGNQEIGNNQSITTFQAGQTAVFDDTRFTTTEPTRMANPDLKWETTQQWNIGFDFGLLEDRIQGTVDYFHKTTHDMLLNLPVPTESGFRTQLRNIGKIENKGFELAVNSRNVVQERFQWSSSVSMATLKNEVLDLGPISQILIGGAETWGESIGIIKPGEPLNSFIGYQVAGIWQEDDDFAQTTDNVKAGDIKFVDQNGDQTVTDADRIILGNSFPDFQASFSNTFNFKGFELFVFFEGVSGMEMLNTKKIETYYPINFRRNKFADPYLNRWTSENPSNKYPSFVLPTMQGVRTITPYTVEDASYIKLRSVRISYTLPSFTKSLRSAQVYLTGENLLTITNYEGIDPAINPNGNANYRIDHSAYPTATTFILGLNLGL